MAQFEQAFGYRQHDHMICNKCGKVMEFCDPRIQQITTKMAEVLNFNVSRHSLNLYGNPLVDELGLCLNCDNQVSVETDK
jgi:Fur family ferric uptake transcriptional regulator